jgi:hypothetical protein
VHEYEHLRRVYCVSQRKILHMCLWTLLKEMEKGAPIKTIFIVETRKNIGSTYYGTIIHSLDMKIY